MFLSGEGEVIAELEGGEVFGIEADGSLYHQCERCSNGSFAIQKLVGL